MIPTKKHLRNPNQADIFLVGDDGQYPAIWKRIIFMKFY